MSFEGHVQVMCANGHYEERVLDDDRKCGCGADIVWENVVDDTNCNQAGVVPEHVLRTLQLTQDVKEWCNLGHLHVVHRATYKIPTEEETQTLRYYFDEDVGWCQ